MREAGYAQTKAKAPPAQEFDGDLKMLINMTDPVYKPPHVIGIMLPVSVRKPPTRLRFHCTHVEDNNDD